MSNDKADVLIFANKTLGHSGAHLFGQFIEMAGRCINNGLYDPTSPHARPDGLRADVVAALQQLRPGHIRYPGGCAVSYFKWQDLVGPIAERPRARLFRSHGSQAQSTAFGIAEAWALCQELGAELYMNVNANTQTTEDAANLVEYLNGTLPTKYADLRRRHGREAPYKVKYFCLGNEIYGNWQPGQKTAAEYANWCAEAIRQMKDVDPSIHVIVCGLGRPDPEWDRTVMFRLIGLADSISAHNYFGRPIFADLMAASRVCEEMFRGLNQVIDEAMDIPLGVHSRAWRDLGALPTVKRRPGIAFDEWNVWYRAVHGPVDDLEEIYNYADALTVASIFQVILRHAATIDLANISLAVNTIGTIFTTRESMVRQTIWHAHKLMGDAHGSGRIVETVVDGPTFKAKHERFFCGIVNTEKAKDETLPTLIHYDDVAAIDTAVTIDEARQRLTISIIQKLEDRPIDVTLDLRGARLDSAAPMSVTRLTHKGDIWAENTIATPDNVATATETKPFATSFTLPPATLTAIEYKLLG